MSWNILDDKVSWANLTSVPVDFSDAKIDWNEVQNKPDSFLPSAHTHPYLPLSGGTLTGWIESNGSGFYIKENSQLGTISGNYQLISSQVGFVANWLTERTWTCRKVNGTNWLTTILHTGVTVDASFATPRVDTRTWWDRDISTGLQAWGDIANTFLSIGNNGFFRIHGVLPITATGLPSGQVWRDSNGFLRIV